MGLFNELGRQIEEFRQRASRAANEGPDYRCANCDAEFATEYETCPDCGADAVVAVDGS